MKRDKRITAINYKIKCLREERKELLREITRLWRRKQEILSGTGKQLPSFRNVKGIL